VVLLIFFFHSQLKTKKIEINLYKNKIKHKKLKESQQCLF
jgi:hypothetical protein